MKIYQNSVVKTSILVVLFYLLYLSSQYIRLAPTVVPIITPIALLYLQKRFCIIFSISYVFLLFISGFQLQSFSIFFLFLLPVILFIILKKFFLYAFIVFGLSLINYYIIFEYFTELIPQFILNSKLFIIIGYLSYFIFLMAYPFALNKLKIEIDNLINKYIKDDEK
ncbi:MAG: hypothetical protein ACQESN_00170 [Thermotogota bacterium]